MNSIVKFDLFMIQVVFSVSVERTKNSKCLNYLSIFVYVLHLKKGKIYDCKSRRKTFRTI